MTADSITDAGTNGFRILGDVSLDGNRTHFAQDGSPHRHGIELRTRSDFESLSEAVWNDPD